MHPNTSKVVLVLVGVFVVYVLLFRPDWSQAPAVGATGNAREIESLEQEIVENPTPDATMVAAITKRDTVARAVERAMYLVQRDFLTIKVHQALYDGLLADIQNMVGREEFKAEIARVDRDKVSVEEIEKIKVAIANCGCSNELPHTVRVLERIVQIPASPVQVQPANPAVPAAPAQPVHHVVLVALPSGQTTFNDGNVSIGATTFTDGNVSVGPTSVNLGGITFPAPDLDRTREVTINVSVPVNVIVNIDNEDLVVNSLQGWCDKLDACTRTGDCDDQLLRALALLCYFEKNPPTDPTYGPTVVWPTGTRTPYTLRTPVPPTVAPTTTTLPGTATSTSVPSAVPTRTMEPTPTTRASATAMLPTSTPGPYCPYPLNGDEYQSTIPGRAYNAIWECKRLWQMWLPANNLRNTYFELSPSFAEGRYTYNGMLCTLYLDLNRDRVLDMTPETIIYGNNQSFTVPAGNGLSWAKVKCEGLPGTGFDVWWLDSAPPTPVPTRACVGKSYPVYDATGAELPEPYHLRWDCDYTILGNPGVNDIPGSEKLPYHSGAIELPIGNWSFKGTNAKITVYHFDGRVDVAALTNAFDFDVSDGPASIFVEDYGAVPGGIAIKRR